MTWRTHPASDFSSLAREWDALNQAAGGIPFLSSPFIQSALVHFGAGDELIALRKVDGKLVCAVILGRIGFSVWRSFQPSQLPLGPFLQETGTRLSDVSIAGLFKVLPGLPLTIDLTQLDPVMVPRNDDATKVSLDYITTAWVDIGGDFETYWANRGKNLRENVKKLSRKLAAEGLNARLEELVSPAEMRGAVSDYAKLETAGWKSAVGTAVSSETAQGRFYVDMMERMATAHRARVYRYSFGDTVVAMDLCVMHGETMVVLKTAYDERFGKLSPATLMREQIFRQIFAEGLIRRVEFYGPMMDWHTRWTEDSRKLYHVTLFRNSPLRAIAPSVKSILRRIRSGTSRVSQ